MRKTLLCLAVLGCLHLAAGCQKPTSYHQTAGSDFRVRVTQTPAGEARGVISEALEVAVVGETGRVMFFGKRGGENAMWLGDIDPAAEGWKNWGGDKAWWWPQDRWGEVLGDGREWPPPVAIDGSAWEVMGPSAGGKIGMQSPVDEALGASLARRFAVYPDEPAMLVDTALVPAAGVGLAGEDGALPAWAVPWTVTQVPTDGPVYARLIEGVDAGDEGWVQTMMGEATETSVVAGRWVAIARLSGKGYVKIGLDADALAVELADGSWLVQRYVGSASGGGFEPAERAQVFQNDRYVELEFIGPSDGGPGSRVFTLEWRLEEGPPWAE
ncbi:MAG: hypothetical protein AAF823_02750 [Planctomycetota bacterium]